MGCGTQIVPNFNEYNKMYTKDNKNPALEMKMSQLMSRSVPKKLKKQPSKTLFHGTSKGMFNSFKLSDNTSSGKLIGSYFTDNYKDSQSWSNSYGNYPNNGPRLIKAKASLNKSASPTDLNNAIEELGGYTNGSYNVKDVTELLIKKGFDSYVSTGYEKDSDGLAETIIFDPTKVKILDNNYKPSK